jgi:hypothetical protein
MSFETILHQRTEYITFTSSQLQHSDELVDGWIPITSLSLHVNHSYGIIAKGVITNIDINSYLSLDLSLLYSTTPLPSQGHKTIDLIPPLTSGQFNPPMSSDQSFTLIGDFETQYVPWPRVGDPSHQHDLSRIYLGLRMQSPTTTVNFQVKSFSILALQNV